MIAYLSKKSKANSSFYENECLFLGGETYMKFLPRNWILGFTFAAWALMNINTANAETFDLQLKRLESQSRMMYRGDDDSRMFRTVRPQYVRFYQPNSSRPDPNAEKFDSIVKKEPEKYECESPFRCVVKLGVNEYAFVFDSTDLSSKGYNLCYFDLNQNGDLTDDEVLKAMELPEGINFGGGYMQREYPRMDVTLKAGDEEYEYSFNLMVYCNIENRGSTVQVQYANASCYASAYREGEITLDGNKHQIVILDFNSNGQFGDEFKIRDDVRTPEG